LTWRIPLLNKILKEVLNQQRKQELELYKLTAKDESFYQAFFDTMKRMIDNPQIGQGK
jgi:type I restriction enzyme R subunit